MYWQQTKAMQPHNSISVCCTWVAVLCRKTTPKLHDC
jgi:hypothetical protein